MRKRLSPFTRRSGGLDCPPWWQPTQYLSSTGCTSRLKLTPRGGPYQGSIGDGLRSTARLGLPSGARFWLSWQPMHDTISPGMAVNQLRITATALPSASSGCTASGVLAGALKLAEPSLSTGTVPQMRRPSQGPSMPMLMCPPMPL